MSNEIAILQTCVILFLLWCFWHYGWKIYALDLYRQSLFSIRENLFEMAANGYKGLSFDNPSYTALRNVLNGRIRFAHRISFTHIMLSFFLSKLWKCDAATSLKTRSDVLIESLEDQELKSAMKDINCQANIIILRLLIMSSLFFFCIVLMTLVCAIITALFKKHFGKAVKESMQKELGPSARCVDIQVEALDAELGLAEPIAV